jgi:hypothetical protein
VYKALPSNIEKDGKQLLSWRVRILPYIEEGNLYEQFKLDEPWDSPHNLTLLDKMPLVYHNPNLPKGNTTNYLGIANPGSIFEPGKPRKFSDITDGLSNTIMVVEAPGTKSVPWTKPVDLTVNTSAPMSDLQGVRPGIFLALFCDGSVQAITFSVDPRMLSALFTINGGEVVNLPRQ